MGKADIPIPANNTRKNIPRKAKLAMIETYRETVNVAVTSYVTWMFVVKYVSEIVSSDDSIAEDVPLSLSEKVMILTGR